MQSGCGGYLARYPIRDLQGNEKWVEGFGAAILFRGQKANLPHVPRYNGEEDRGG